MKALLLSAAALLFPALRLFAVSTTSPATETDLAVNSRISDVTVYLDRARVTRAAEVELPAGESLIRFTGLPATLDDSSVQASGESSSKVTIQGIEIRNKFSERTVNEAVLKLQEEIQKLDDEFRKLDDETRDINDRRAFLQQLRDGVSRDMGKSEKGSPMTAAQIKALFDLYGTELKALTERTRAIDLERRDLQPKRAKLQNELNRLVSCQPTVQREVLVSVRSAAASTAKLKVSYVMPGATWQPIYDARARVDASRIELGYYAQIRQRTGEDWRDVKLSLSTARPSLGARMPELNPWWLLVSPPATPMAAAVSGFADFRRDQKQKAALMRNEVASRRMAEGLEAYDELRERESNDKGDKPLEMDTAALDTRGTSAVFQVKIPANIPSDGEPHKTMIATGEFKGKLDYVTTPKLVGSAFLKARLVNEGDAPILGGPVNLFLEDDFIGQSYVNYIAPTAEFDFYLGVDDGIKVTRKQTVDRTETSGIFSKQDVSIRKFEIEVANYKKTPQTVTVYDQIPVSQNEQIKVTGVKYSDNPKTVEKESGKVTWELALKPGEKRKITLEFAVERPAGLPIGI
jgi:uncharacterized protein (TIGR02231 family)